MRKWTLLLLISLLILLPACRSSSEEPVEADPAEVTETQISPEEEQRAREKEERKAREEQERKEREEAQRKALEEERKRQEQVASAMNILEVGYRDYGDFTYDEVSNSFILEVTDENLIGMLPFLKSGFGRGQWQEVTKSFVSFSEYIEEHVAPGYTIVVSDPSTEGEILLSVKDGDILYNIVD